MRRLKLLVLLFGPIALAATLAQALANDHGMYAAYGVATSPCSQFVTARDTEATNAFMGRVHFAMMSWALGYLTHYNVVFLDTYSILGTKSASDLDQQLYTYCKSNPSDNFGVAVNKLSIILHATRAVHAPPQAPLNTPVRRPK